MAKRDESLLNIRHQLSVLEVEARLNNKVNRQGVNLSAEDILGGLLNLLRDWNLRNANADGQNFPAIDLADWDEGVVVQVSSDTSASKIRETLEKLKNPEFADKEINRLVMMFLKPKLKYTTVFEHDGFELEILDFDDLSSAVEHKSYAKLQEISAYLDEEVGKLTGTVNPKPAHLLPPVPLPSASFVEGSRDRELEELKEKLSPDAPVFLYGVGGIGKTELTIQLAKRFAPPEGAYFLHYYDTEGEALRETILRANFTGYSYQKADTENRDHEYKERMDILRTEYPGALLIIDNFDCTGRTIAQLQAEPAYRELTAMGIRLVFTTRSRVRGGCEIEPLRPEHLLKLMRDNLDGGDVSDAELRQLIEAVDGHTLMVVLMARTLAASCGNLKPADILKALEESRINSGVFRKVANEHNPANPQARIYDHMKALFVLTDMNEIEQDVLRWATLLPENGMDAGLFQSCLKDNRLDHIPDAMMEQLLSAAREEYGDEAGSDEELRQLLGEVIAEIQEDGDNRQDTMNFLIDRGWLAKDDRNLLTIHPVIREVCREELEPTDENCEEFLFRLGEHFDKQKFFDAEKFAQIAGCFSVAADRLADAECSFALRAGWFWSQLGQTWTALRYNLQMVRRLENYPEAAPNALMTAYNNLGLAYGALGDHEQALEYQLKALTICEKVLPPDHPGLAASYNNVGSTYGTLGNHRQALEYKQKALAICEKVLPQDYLNRATAYNNVGLTYGALGDHHKALEYQQKDLAICENVLPPDHPNLALSYSNISVTYGNMGDYEKGLEYDLKALVIQEKVLPPEHPDLAISYNNIGTTYAYLEQFSKAAEYLEKALAIFRKALPAEHPYIASTEKNLRYFQSRAELREAGISPEDFEKMMESQED